ncbi:MAG: hypothetical protein ACTSVA_09450 [Candidatus Njordarchaeales archaeon]
MGSLKSEDFSNIMKKVISHLEKIFNEREILIRECRKVFPMIRDVFKYAHRRELEKAFERIQEATKKIEEIAEFVSNRKELISSGIWTDLEREYVEAMIFLQILRKCLDKEETDDILSPWALKVEITSWILGLCEVAGELKRQILLSVHNEEFDVAWCFLRWIRKIYEEVSKLSFPSSIIPNLKAKVDYVRNMLISSEEILIRVEKCSTTN